MERSPEFAEIADDAENPQGTSFHDLEVRYKHDELLGELARDVVYCARRYFQVVMRFERLRDYERFHLEPVEYRFQMDEMDRNRRLTHISLCDKLAVLSRASLSQGIENEWFEKIAGRNADRDAIKRWAFKVRV